MLSATREAVAEYCPGSGTLLFVEARDIVLWAQHVVDFSSQRCYVSPRLGIGSPLSTRTTRTATFNLHHYTIFLDRKVRALPRPSTYTTIPFSWIGKLPVLTLEDAVDLCAKKLGTSCHPGSHSPHFLVAFSYYNPSGLPITTSAIFSPNSYICWMREGDDRFLRHRRLLEQHEATDKSSAWVRSPGLITCIL